MHPIVQRCKFCASPIDTRLVTFLGSYGSTSIALVRRLRFHRAEQSKWSIRLVIVDLGDAKHPDITRQLAFRSSNAYTILEQAEDMLNTHCTEFLALAEQYLKLHLEYLSSVDELVGKAPMKRQKPQQEYIAIAAV